MQAWKCISHLPAATCRINVYLVPHQQLTQCIMYGLGTLDGSCFSLPYYRPRPKGYKHWMLLLKLISLGVLHHLNKLYCRYFLCLYFFTTVSPAKFKFLLLLFNKVFTGHDKVITSLYYAGLLFFFSVLFHECTWTSLILRYWYLLT